MLRALSFEAVGRRGRERLNDIDKACSQTDWTNRKRPSIDQNGVTLFIKI